MENDTLLSETLALKGGTAINLTIFNLPRLSVDIDLDFSQNLPRTERYRKDLAVCPVNTGICKTRQIIRKSFAETGLFFIPRIIRTMQMPVFCVNIHFSFAIYI